MSPDPPREDSGDDENRIRRFSGDFMEGMINDDEFFIVPDTPYELDMEEESEYSDDSEEEGAVGGATTSSRNPNRTQLSEAALQAYEQEFLFQEAQGRGRYRLLIPFPTSTTTADPGAETVCDITNDTGITEGMQQVSCNASSTDAKSAGDIDKTGSAERPCTSSTQPRLPEEKFSEQQSSNRSDEKREIELSDEKVEKIKEVMKNITLPSASIPTWASEIDEEAWRKKLNDSISSSSRHTCKTDKTVKTE